jgi:hypothetical protein
MDSSNKQTPPHPIISLVESYFVAHASGYVPSQLPSLWVIDAPSGFHFSFGNATSKRFRFKLRFFGFKNDDVSQINVDIRTWNNNNQRKWSEKKINHFEDRQIREITCFDQFKIVEIDLKFRLRKDSLEKSAQGVVVCVFRFSLVTSSNYECTTEVPMTNVTHITNQVLPSDILKLFLWEVMSIKKKSIDFCELVLKI